MKNKIYLTILLGFISLTTVFGNATKYTSPPTGYSIVTSTAQWTSLPWTTSTISGTQDEYVIGAGYTIQIGNTSPASCNVNLGNVLITLFGRIGFKAGNNDLILASASEIDIMAGGQFGFGNGADFQGNSISQVTFGTTIYSGGYLAFGPDQMNATSGGFQSSYLWTGTVSADWGVAGNWQTVSTNPAAPTASANVVIPSSPVGGHWPSVSAAYSTKRLSVQPGASLTIKPIGSLTVTDSLINWGDFTINAGGVLVQTTASNLCGNCSGGTFDVDIQTGPTSPWFMGSPIVGLSESQFSSCGNGQYSVISCGPTVIGGTSPCVMVLNEDATTTSINCASSLWSYESASSFTGGEGYNIYGTPGVMAFSGTTVNNGPVSYGPLGYSSKGPVNLPSDFSGQTTRGWHMVSNPYPSPIQLTGAQLSAMGFEAQIQVWSSASGNWISSNPLATLTIAPGQGFQIRVAGGAGSFGTFAVDNSFRVATTGTPFYKTQTVPQQQYVNITLSNGNTAQNNTAMVYFQDGATPGFDPAYDANRLFGLATLPYIFTKDQSGQALSFNALPLLTAYPAQTVPVSVINGGVGAMTLTFDAISTLGAVVILEDLKTGTMYPVTDGYVHSFSVQTGDSQNRFLLHFNAANATGITDLSNTKVTLFPNPATGYVTILFPQDQGFDEVLIYDLEGKMIFSDQISKNMTMKSIDIRSLNNGLYTIKLKGVSSITQKFVKI